MIKLPPDITFVIQLVAFVVFWQLLRVILFQPVQRALEARKLQTAGARRQAEGLEAETISIRSQVTSRLEEARVRGAAEAEDIRRNAETREREILGRYHDQATALLEDERAITAKQIEAARAPLHAEAERIADSVVAKILGRKAA